MIDGWEENETLYTVAELIDLELQEADAWGEGLPVSYSLLYKTMQLTWVNLIISALFMKKMEHVFAEEFSSVIESMSEYDKVTDKRYPVYRDLQSGDVVFGTAGRIYLSASRSVMMQKGISKSEIRVTMLRDLDSIYKSYEKVGEYFGDVGYILNMKNFSDETVKEQLGDFCKKLLSELE